MIIDEALRVAEGGGVTVGLVIFFSSKGRHTIYWRDWSSDVCSSDLGARRTAATSPDQPAATVDGAASTASGRSSSNASYRARTAVSSASSAMIVVIRISLVEI